MSALVASLRIHGRGARLASPMASLAAGVDLDVIVDAESLTLSGGDPLSAWQLPLVTLLAARAKRVGDYVEITGWVSGSHLELTIPVLTLESGSAEDLLALILESTKQAEQGGSLDLEDARGRERPARLAALAILVVALVIAVIVALVLSSSQNSSSATATPQERSAAAAKNLALTDLPSSWSQDSISSSPLSGLLGTSPTSKATPSETKIYQEIVSKYQACMGESSQSDRMFGAAGVAPLVQEPSAPFGTSLGSDSLEVGSVTQLYASTSDVQADLTQMKQPQFSACFAETMGRFTAAGSDPNLARAVFPVKVEKARSEMGAYISGAVVTIKIPSTAGILPIEIGTSIVISGRYEQTLYTFSSPGSFPPTERQHLEGVLAARLAGMSGAVNN